jgi:diguanylate cyclase
MNEGCVASETDQASADQVAETARKVILTMSRLSVPLLPENYAVWFDYVTGCNEALIEEIEEKLKKGVTFTDSMNRDLYERHVGPLRNSKVMEEVSQQLRRVLRESLEKIVSTGSVTQDYALKLKDFLGGLEAKARQPTDFREMIVRLILDTRTMEQSTLDLRGQLEKAEKESNELRDRLQRVEREATLDVLTGIHNRKHMEKALASLYENYVRKGTRFSIMMLDLDHFKRVNDTYGHKVGDAVLQFVGGVLKETVKGRDIPARYGGEEFVILLPMTDCSDACKVAEQLRREISKKPLTIRQSGERIGTVTVSIGVAMIREGDSIDAVIHRADQALYCAKRQGRNNVKSENDLSA